MIDVCLHAHSFFFVYTFFKVFFPSFVVISVLSVLKQWVGGFWKYRFVLQSRVDKIVGDFFTTPQLFVGQPLKNINAISLLTIKIELNF